MSSRERFAPNILLMYLSWSSAERHPPLPEVCQTSNHGLVHEWWWVLWCHSGVTAALNMQLCCFSRRFGHSAKIVHFTGAVKPWSSQREQSSSQVMDQFVFLWWKEYLSPTTPSAPETQPHQGKEKQQVLMFVAWNVDVILFYKKSVIWHSWQMVCRCVSN